MEVIKPTRDEDRNDLKEEEGEHENDKRQEEAEVQDVWLPNETAGHDAEHTRNEYLVHPRIAVQTLYDLLLSFFQMNLAFQHGF